jgi:predicted AlkP superfamily pyrophosphatase or phosphodiesterase
MRLSRLLAVTLTALVLVHAAAIDAPSSPRVSRVLVVSVDGLRPDVLLRANAPVLRALMDGGSFTMWAATTDLAVTLPSHVSMLTGVVPARHGVTWNGDLPAGVARYPKSPTLFDVAKRAGLTTAMVAGKSKFAALARPGSLDRWYAPQRGIVADAAVADTAVRWIDAHRPQVLFVHLPDGDRVGHSEGWGSAGHLKSVEQADRQLGRILQALAMRRVLDSTVVIVSADHGGSGRSHGAGDVRSLTIPWIISGPGVRRNFDLAQVQSRNVRTEDTFATACAVLGLSLTGELDGSPVREAFETGR